MNVSVELTLSPLQDDFEPAIIAFIKALRDSGLTILENPLSTQVYGNYETVMAVLQKEIGTTFDSLDHVVLHMKLVKSDRSDYQPFF
jgi:uncharacterized protein YqgV (UPF0045/DUF77 family)